MKFLMIMLSTIFVCMGGWGKLVISS